MATDYYKECEDRLAASLKTLTQFITSDWQVMNGDESGLMKGAKFFIRLHPGGFSDTSVESGEVTLDWEIELKIYVKFEELQKSWDNFRTFRAEVFFKVLQHPSLNSITGFAALAGVTSVRIGAGESPVYIVDDPEVADPTPLFISQTLLVTVRRTKIAITGGEYA
jgi:hypothetical protein